jgi:N-acetylneuraminic acid mutarotase
MPTPRYGVAAATVNDRIYIIGGTQQQGEDLSTVEAYDPLTDTWTSLAPMPTARYAPTATAIGPTIYVIGGSYPSDNRRVLQTVEAYDTGSNTWVTLSPMPTARQGLASAIVNGSDVIAVGGATDAGNAWSSAVEEYLP